MSINQFFSVSFKCEETMSYQTSEESLEDKICIEAKALHKKNQSVHIEGNMIINLNSYQSYKNRENIFIFKKKSGVLYVRTSQNKNVVKLRLLPLPWVPH